MTIRDVLAARRTRLVIAAIVCWLGFAAILLNFYGLRCPRCSGPIGMTQAPLKGGGGGLRRRMNFCAYCGVSLAAAWDAQQPR
jgi:hypothetical protein